MKNRPSVVRKVLLSISGIIAVIAIAVAYFVTSERASTVEQTVTQEIRRATQQAAFGIHEFFRERSRVVTSLQANPFVNDWFGRYSERGSSIDNDKQYQQIVDLFKNESDHDPMIKSVFYAPAATHEYFDINGRYNDPNYFTSKRPWWFEALEKDRLFITNPEIDANDGSIVTSIKTTVYSPSRTLLGVMGIDILASEIKSGLIDKMHYQNEGYGFLYTADGRIISFPDEANNIDMSTLPTLDQVDSLISHANGFKALLNDSKPQQELLTTLDFKGEQYLALVAPITDETMALDWRVGFMVPMHAITDPVTQTTYSSIFSVILVLALTSGVIFITIQRLLTKPLKRVMAAMDDIATGDGDLTKRIDINTNDELGQLSESFNTFVENIQKIISQCNLTTQKVLSESDDVSHLVADFSSTVGMQKGYIEQIATAATEMTQTIHGISDNAQTSLDYATKAANEAKQGKALADNANTLINDLANEVSHSTEVVNALHKNSESISAVLEVIKNIAEQTNLLALNAAIEAARAGEQGRGFAVVADEVRTLASRTQDSTGDIEKIIVKLQESASSAVAAMNVGKEKTTEGVSVILQVSEKLDHINQAVALIEEQSNEAASTIKEQASASDEITQQTISVNELADQAVHQTSDMALKSESQKAVTQELTATISQFKV
ncbi:methyl-accepting chemotaxis protein [Thalassotalea sp. LPB0316]|uniref:methyl-accepting chemotaxis protein n=1 Tax=Thalassotalea sp. LPB0316 TaxID=2769490 RepID=UPI001868DC86|nr:methyl-accepting chemotaxis protein [Thalassotalea sp. LPB0316]QOL25521.1 methyl-accepting chemotaxis protein [Thalassotalea sp. LPB0316]